MTSRAEKIALKLVGSGFMLMLGVFLFYIAIAPWFRLTLLPVPPPSWNPEIPESLLSGASGVLLGYLGARGILKAGRVPRDESE